MSKALIGILFTTVSVFILNCGQPVNHISEKDGEIEWLSLGFINGIIQIGRLYENVEQVSLKNKISTFSKFIPQQSFTHDLGINCREQLFIKNQILRGI